MNRYTPTFIARLITSGFFGLICLAIVVAPWLADGTHRATAGPLYLCFSFVCHQNPERSFTYHGHPWAVCHRCAGIYAGMLLAAVLPQALFSAAGSLRWRRIWVWAASAPLLVEWALPLTGVWRGSALTRFSTGLLFGLMLTSLLVLALAQLLAAPLQRQAGPGGADIQGVAT